MIVYIDADFKCHASNDGALTAIETDFFAGKCAAYIEGYRFVPAGESWTREDGVDFRGKMIAPWKPWDDLDAAQRAYERELLATYEQQVADLDAAYEEGVQSV